MPEWARRERASDLKWVQENMHVLWPAAERSYIKEARGAIVVDTTAHPTGAGNPFFYMSEAGVEKLNDADALRMVKAYDPDWELVAVLLKQEKRVSTYRIGNPAARKDRTSLTE
jgi:hypothetical protein